MKTYCKIFTKEDAERIILEQNTNNYRTTKEHVVKMYADEMSNGRWMVNGDSIRFDKNGVLIDGQHRLKGVIKSGIAQEFVVVEDLDPECVKTIDIAHKRSIEDYLKNQEEGYTKGATAIVKIVMNLRKSNKQIGQSAGNGSPSLMMVVDEYVRDRDNYAKATAYGKGVSKDSKGALKPSHVGAIFYYLVHELGIDEDYVKDFFFSIVNTTRNDKTIYGKTFEKLENKDGKLGRSMREIMNVYITCWNARIHNCTTRLQSYSEWFELPPFMKSLTNDTNEVMV